MYSEPNVCCVKAIGSREAYLRFKNDTVISALIDHVHVSTYLTSTPPTLPNVDTRQRVQVPIREAEVW